MPVLCLRPWLITGHSSRSFVKLDSNCKCRRGYNFRTNILKQTKASRLLWKVVPISANAEQGRYGTENVNERKYNEPSEDTVSALLGSRLNFNLDVEKDGIAPCVSWITDELRRDLVNEEAEIQSLDVQEDQSRPVVGKFREGGSTYNNLEANRHGGRLGRRAAIVAAGTAVFTTGNCLCCSKAFAQGSVLEWDYVLKWQGLCALGPKQSPIDIPLSRAKSGESLGELQFHYFSSSPSVVNPGHGTMQVSFPQGKNILRVGGRTLELLQFHFHAPSEHAFNGERFAMEAHLVHRDIKTEKLAVVGIMLDANKFALPNKALAESLTYAPAEYGQSVHVHDVTFSPGLLLPKVTKNSQRGYVHYVGSLSTPPCSEGVDWFVLEKSLEIPTSQVLDFLKFAGGGHSLSFNSRPLQPLGDRVVYKGP